MTGAPSVSRDYAYMEFMHRYEAAMNQKIRWVLSKCSARDGARAT